MRLLLACLFAWLLSACSSPTVPTPDMSNAGLGRVATVVRVVDGDTVRVESGGQVSVRILGIDSPETKHPDKPVECGGPESSAWAESVLPRGSTVRLQFEPGREQTDRYGRLLAYVEFKSSDNEWVDFSTTSAALGHSKNYVYDNRPVSKQDMIAQAEASARGAGVGLWSCPENGDH